MHCLYNTNKIFLEEKYVGKDLSVIFGMNGYKLYYNILFQNNLLDVLYIIL